MQTRTAREFEEYSPSANLYFFVKAYPTKEGLSVVLRDITESKKLREELQLERTNLLAIINNSTDMIWSIDTDLRLTSFNQCYADIVKKAFNNTPRIGEKASSYALTKEEQAKWDTYFRWALKGEVYKIEDELFYNGEAHYIETRLYPIKDEKKKIIGLSCNSRDITDYRNYLKLVEEQNKKLREIAWIQSHKLRSPLATILGLTDLYNKEDISDKGNLEIIEQLRKAALKLDDIVHEVIKNSQTASDRIAQN